MYKHHTNEEFKCVVVKFTESDAFFIDRMDWLPKFSDLEKIIEGFIKCDPKYREELKRLVRNILQESEQKRNNTLDKFKE